MKKPLWVLLLCLFSVVLTAAQGKMPLIHSGEIIRKGIDQHDSGNYKAAINYYLEVPRSDTNYIWALYELSLSYTADSQYHQALDACERGLRGERERRREPDLYDQYASLIDDMGDPNRALRIYDSAIHKYPAFAPLYLNKGTTLLKLERYADAETTLQQGLLIDPYSASSHYMLGVAAINEGKIIPAMLSFINYLVVSPNGRYSSKSINFLSVIARNKDDLTPILKKRKTGAAEEYRLTEQIVLSKIALDEQYKPLIKLDDPISRQIQVVFEKLEYNRQSSDFWMQYYVPLYKKIFDKKELEPFINYIFSDVDLDAIKTYIRKHKKEMHDLIAEIVAYYNDIRSTRELNFTRRSSSQLKYLIENGKPAGRGAYTADGKNLTGPWTFYYSSGNLRSTGAFNDKGGRTGDWVYYNFSGQVDGREHYLAGKLDGHAEYYFDNGNKSSDMNYRNGKLHGHRQNWYLVGTPRVSENYRDGLLEGERITYFSNGDPQTLAHYRGDSLQGPYQTFYQNGRTETSGTYVNGVLEGKAMGYHPNGKIKFEGKYVKGQKAGEWKTFFDNGQLEKLENYVNDELEGKYTEYYRNGNLFTEYEYHDGKMNGEVKYRDDDGKMFSIFIFNNDRLVNARYYDKQGKLISQSQGGGKNWVFTSYRPDGTKKSEAAYDANGTAEGTETYYFESGRISETNHYSKGRLEGTSRGYYPNGKTRSEVPYAGGQRQGYYRSWFIHGALQSEGWYVDNGAEGNWNFYDELGNLIRKTNYYKDEKQGYSEEYWPNGKRKSETVYQYGWIKKYRQFDSTGKLIHQVDLHTGSGTYTELQVNGKPYIRGQYLNGAFDGPYTIYFFDGSVETQVYYHRGLPDSTYRDYFYGGQVHAEGQYFRGDKTGTWKYYAEDGKLTLVEKYENGKLNGKRIYYQPNGKPDVEMDMENDNKEGWLRKYDPDGELLYQLHYDDDMPVGYSYLDPSGKAVAEIPIPASTGKVTTYYSNGQVSGRFEYADGKLIGKDILFFPNGKKMRESTESYSESEGKQTEYYPNGQIREENEYLHDNLHGTYRHYDEKGVLLEQGQLYNGSPHGEVKYYDATGHQKAVYHYYFGKLLSVEK